MCDLLAYGDVLVVDDGSDSPEQHRVLEASSAAGCARVRRARSRRRWR
ncbi:MAG: hypothetical protein ACYDHH_22435 [Solirubrobacteraceae bacterium]